MADPQSESFPAASRGEGASEAVSNEAFSKETLSNDARSQDVSTDVSSLEDLSCDDLSNAELVRALQADRLWLLRQLDSGAWPEWRLDLAALERELGELLDRVAETAE